MARKVEFKIDVWTPATIPQKRLGEYLIQVAELYGESESIRFSKIRKGSAVLVSEIDEPAVPKVQQRIHAIRAGQGTKDEQATFERLDEMLARDNATAVVRGLEDGNKVLRFPGREREVPVDYGLIWEDGILEGEIVRIGGRGIAVHVALQYGNTVVSDIETTRDIARQLGSQIFGPLVRLHGRGAWRKINGAWARERFVVSHFLILEDRSLLDALGDIRAIGRSEWHRDGDPVAALLFERNGSTQ